MHTLAADRRYDCTWLREYLREIGIRRLIKLCINKPYDYAHNARIDDDICGQRSISESVFSSVKRSQGVTLRARSWYREFRELALMCAVYNIRKAAEQEIFDYEDDAVLTATEVTEGLRRFGKHMTSEGVRNRLEAMAEEGLVSRKKIGARAVEWWAEVAPELDAKTANIVDARKKTDEWGEL